MKIIAESKFVKLEINVKADIKDSTITKSKIRNVFFDMLRGQDFDVENIKVVSDEN